MGGFKNLKTVMGGILFATSEYAAGSILGGEGVGDKKNSVCMAYGGSVSPLSKNFHTVFIFKLIPCIFAKFSLISF